MISVDIKSTLSLIDIHRIGKNKHEMNVNKCLIHYLVWLKLFSLQPCVDRFNVSYPVEDSMYRIL